VEDTTPTKLERFGGGAWENGQGDVSFGFFVDAFADNLGSELGALSAC